RGERSPTRGTLAKVDFSAPPPLLTLLDIGPTVDEFYYNAMGYNPKDDFLYAIKLGDLDDKADLIRIGADGSPKYVATLPELKAGRSDAIVGDFDDDGYYYVANDNQFLYKYDLSGPTPVLVFGDVKLDRL